MPETLTEYSDTSQYPYILHPKKGSSPTKPDEGRLRINEHFEKDLYNRIARINTKFKISNAFSLTAVGKAMPFEIPITVFDDETGTYIAVELDVPYHGYYRFPMHYGESNAIKDKFLTDNGWHVLHFSEKQVADNPDGCAEFVMALASKLTGGECNTTGIARENRWDIRKAIEWEKDFYREKYLKISMFQRPEYLDRLISDIKNAKSIGDSSGRFPKIVFNEDTHSYYDERNSTGAANYVSVTSLIDKFFPYFDEEAYIKKFMDESGKTREEVVRKMLEPSERGTMMHRQIELFLKGEECEKGFKEFALFEQFHKEQILRRGLRFHAAEMQIAMPEYNIAGTVDALFVKPNGEYVMIDWKRSKNLIIDGHTKKYGHGSGLSVLAHLDNSSYYHYELQQSFYKYILEREYNIKVSSMILAVLHPDYDRYYTIKLSDYRSKEVVEMIAAHCICNR